MFSLLPACMGAGNEWRHHPVEAITLAPSCYGDLSTVRKAPRRRPFSHRVPTAALSPKTIMATDQIIAGQRPHAS